MGYANSAYTKTVCKVYLSCIHFLEYRVYLIFYFCLLTVLPIGSFPMCQSCFRFRRTRCSWSLRTWKWPGCRRTSSWKRDNRQPNFIIRFALLVWNLIKKNIFIARFSRNLRSTKITHLILKWNLKFLCGVQ